MRKGGLAATSECYTQGCYSSCRTHTMLLLKLQNAHGVVSQLQSARGVVSQLQSTHGVVTPVVECTRRCTSVVKRARCYYSSCRTHTVLLLQLQNAHGVHLSCKAHTVLLLPLQMTHDVVSQLQRTHGVVYQLQSAHGVVSQSYSTHSVTAPVVEHTRLCVFLSKNRRLTPHEGNHKYLYSGKNILMFVDHVVCTCVLRLLDRLNPNSDTN